VAILMGSDSDLSVMAEAAKVLGRFEVPYDLEVTSAHRSPERTAEIVRAARQRGVQVFVVGAGGAAHLAGAVAAHTSLPVLAVPLASSDLQGLDALLATVQMPAGVPVGTLAIGKAGAANAALLACEILALADADLEARLEAYRHEMKEEVARKSERAKRTLGALIGARSPAPDRRGASGRRTRAR
jgi:phosphoribosylaminoimidazole carboxylase PurE protein